MGLFKTRWITRFARREDIADAALKETIDRAERGLMDADLGGGLIKQRVARPSKGRSGGYRTLIGYRHGDRAIFLFGFTKHQLDNIGEQKQTELHELGAFWLRADGATIDNSLRNGRIAELDYGEEICRPRSMLRSWK